MKKLIILISLVMPMFASAANGNELSSTSNFSNPLFNTLLIVIIVLLIMIVGLGNALKNTVSSDFIREKLKKEREENENSSKKVIGTLLLVSVISLSTYAQEKLNIQPVNDNTIGGLDQATFYTMFIIIVVELIVLGLLFNVFKNILNLDKQKIVVPVVKQKTKTLLDKLNGTVEIEMEESIMLDHDYDGIRELDNDLPPWWKYGFYLTIVVAVFYMINYHISKTAPLQAEEYTNAIKKAEKEIAEYMKNSANNVDESTVKLLTDPADINAGKDIFISTCSACHGKFGEGTVGPNLTDDYWLHSGGVADIFKTIKYGWPDKGMKSWKEDFSPVQIAQLTSYIRTLKGTNPPKPKDKQGELYLEKIMIADSTSLETDSLKIITGDTTQHIH